MPTKEIRRGNWGPRREINLQKKVDKAIKRVMKRKEPDSVKEAHIQAIRAMAKALKRARGPCALGDALGGISGQAISMWEICPLERVISVEEFTGVSRLELYPFDNGFGAPDRSLSDAQFKKLHGEI